ASPSSSPSPLDEIVSIRGEMEAEEITKKSRFIARSAPATTFEQAKEILASVQKKHIKARHNCWAWRGLGGEHRYSDDGEPG
ncbi:unnamed protein product, partial [Choristocarpus tenellus]